MYNKLIDFKYGFLTLFGPAVREEGHPGVTVHPRKKLSVVVRKATTKRTKL
jgi:hypothetical protein